MGTQTNDRHATQTAREADYRRDNQSQGREVMPQRAVAELFSITATAVRAAVRAGHVDVAFSLDESLGGRTAKLIDLGSARKYWRHRAPDNLDNRLEAMRENCVTIAIPQGPDDKPHYMGFNVLNGQESASIYDR